MKQRLVGAVVLVALAVIFLPMLLDGSGQSGPRDVAIDIPDQPQPPRNRLDESPNAATDNRDAGGGDIAAAPSGAQSQPGTMSEQPVPSSTSGEGATPADQPSADDTAPAAPSADTNASPASDTTTNEAAPAAAPSPETDDAPEADDRPEERDSTADAPDSGADQAGGTSWVVQVGSFGRETNALVLRDRLRELGFETFVERADTDQGAVWRVRVGPVASEEEAERLSERVTEERGGPALVMTQP